MKQIEARIKISAVDKTGAVLGNIGKRLDKLGRTQENFARTFGLLARFAGPAALAYGIKESVSQFAEVERKMTRIGITADASADQVKAATAKLRELAMATGLSFTSASDGLDTLVASGLSLQEAMAFLPSVLNTAQATGAEVSDVANTAMKASSALKITAGEMDKAFDIMVAGGKAGQFELKDMAAYIPGLANSFATLGYEGRDGLKMLIAVMQTLREDTGSAEAAATQAQNIFGKMYSEETANRFKKFGIDLRKEMETARAAGKDALTAFVDLSKAAIKGDLSKLPLLFSDQEFRLGMQSLITSPEALQKFIAAVNGPKVEGTVLRDVGILLDQTQAKITNLGTSWDTMVQQIGASASTYLTPAMEGVTKFLSDRDAYNAGFDKLGGDGPLLRSQMQEFMNRAAEAKLPTDSYRQITENWEKAVRAYGRGEVPSIMDWITQESLRTDSKGILAANYGQYQRGGGVPNPLNASPQKYNVEKGIVPINTWRPSPAEMAAIKEAEREAQRAAGYAHGTGRETVKFATGEAELNKFYGTSETPDAALRHLARKKRALGKGDAEMSLIEDRIAANKSREDAKAAFDAVISAFDKRRDTLQGRRDGDVSPEMQSAMQELSKLSHRFDEGGQRIESAGSEFAAAVGRAADNLASRLGSLDIKVNTSGTTPKVNANTGRTDTFARSPGTGHQ